MKVILLVGEAGTGKTWVMKKLIELFELEHLGKVGMILFHRDETKDVFVLGKYDGSTFEGSDKLSMAVMRDLPEFVKYATVARFVICEGDRFMNSTFIEGAKPYIIKIVGDGAEGRKKRGSNQTERQLKTIATRVKNVREHALVEKSSTALKMIKEIIDGRKKV